MKSSIICLCAIVFSTSLLACADEAEETNAPLSCAIDLPRDECEAAGCTLETTSWRMDFVEESSLAQACKLKNGPSKSCLPLLTEAQGDEISFFQRELPNGDKELITLSSIYPSDALVGWSGCWINSGPIPEDLNFVDCRCAPW